MTFNEIEVGYPIYIFDKEKITTSEGKVLSKSGPKYDTHFSSAVMVIELAIDIDGESKNYTFKTNTEVGYTDNLSLCTNKETLLREIEARKAQQEATIKQIETAMKQLEKIKEDYTKCVRLAVDLNPALKEKQESEQWRAKMEQEIESLSLMMKQFVQHKRNE